MDITMCMGTGCPIKDKCYRYKATADKYQSYLMDILYKDGKCEMFWGVQSEAIMNQRERIMGGDGL